MGPGGEDDDRTMQFPHAATAQPEAYDRLAHAAPGSDEKPTLIAASPSQSMLLVADPAEEDASPPGSSGSPHPADDEPNTMLTQAPRMERAPDSAPCLPESRPRLPTPRMDLRMYTPASIGPTALTLAPPSASSHEPTSIPRSLPIPFPRFEVREPLAPKARLHPAAWIAVGMVLGAAAMAAILTLRGSNASREAGNAASANVPVETDLDKIAPMPSARPVGPSRSK